MLSRFIIWFGKLSTFVKSIVAVIVFCSTLWGLKVGYDRIIINRHDREQEIIDSEIERDRKIDELIYSNSMVVDTLTVLLTGFRELVITVDGLVSVNKNLRTYQMANAKSTDELLQIIKIWDTEKKNSGIDLLPIVLRQEE